MSPAFSLVAVTVLAATNNVTLMATKSVAALVLSEHTVQLAPSPPSPPYPAHTGPLTCQPNDKFPMLPTFHIIGNVTEAANGGINLEPINDCSGVTFHNGIYHVWHQCCQNHWDHVGCHCACPLACRLRRLLFTYKSCSRSR